MLAVQGGGERSVKNGKERKDGWPDLQIFSRKFYKKD